MGILVQTVGLEKYFLKESRDTSAVETMSHQPIIDVSIQECVREVFSKHIEYTYTIKNYFKILMMLHAFIYALWLLYDDQKMNKLQSLPLCISLLREVCRYLKHTTKISEFYKPIDTGELGTFPKEVTQNLGLEV